MRAMRARFQEHASSLAAPQGFSETVGNLHDVQEVLDNARNPHDLHDWDVFELETALPTSFQTSPPLPPWFDIRMEQVLPAEKPD